jgi:pimeloyl-ACP methyl ester carboxylesterase
MVADAVALSQTVAARPDTRDRVAIFGVSLGATVALLAAEDPELARRVSVVVGIAPYTDLVNVIRLGTTGYTRDGDRLVYYGTQPFLTLAVARSIVAGLPPGAAKEQLASALAGIPSDDPDPLARIRGVELRDPAGQAVLELLLNRNPDRFDELYQALPEELRAQVRRLSPIARPRRLEAPVELASAPRDAYFPAAESLNLARVAPDVRVTVTDAFSHVIPRPSLGDPGDLLAFDGWAVRSLRAARD